MTHSSLNILLIAGEKSGEEHALSFIPKLKSYLPNLHFWGVGGDELKSGGMELIYHLKDFSSFGFSEVFAKIPFYLRALDEIENQVIERNCKVAILIDFQGFNMRLAKRLKKIGVRVLYYVAPQAWAWKEWRAKVIGETVHTLFTIINFEKKWFEERGASNVVSVSHPLWYHYHKKVEEIGQIKLSSKGKPYKKFLTEINLLLLPGSRNSEVKYLVKTFIQTAKNLQNKLPVKIGIVKSRNVNPMYFSPYDADIHQSWEDNQLDEALIWADFSIATSGTVTLTCALFSVPTIVNYDSSLFNEWFYFTFITYRKFVSLANIVHQKEVFPELLGEQCDPISIELQLRSWVDSEENYLAIKKDLGQTLKLIDKSEVDVSDIMRKNIEESYG